MAYVLTAWLSAALLIAIPALILGDSLVVAVGPVALLAMAVGTYRRQFHWFTVAALSLFAEYIWLASDAQNGISGYGALAAGILLMVLLEAGYMACLLPKTGHSRSSRQYTVSDEGKDSKRLYQAMLLRIGGTAAIGLPFPLLLTWVRRADLPEKLFFPILLVTATALAILVYWLLARKED